jgi:hypothetical protein
MRIHESMAAVVLCVGAWYGVRDTCKPLPEPKAEGLIWVEPPKIAVTDILDLDTTPIDPKQAQGEVKKALAAIEKQRASQLRDFLSDQRKTDLHRCDEGYILLGPENGEVRPYVNRCARKD